MADASAIAMLKAARELVAAGLSALAVRPDTKEPWHKWKELQTRLPTEEELRENFDRRGPWIGFACGEGAGNVEAIDFDVPGKHQLPPGQTGAPPAYEPWRQMVAEHGGEDLLARLVLARTPSGGVHAFYRCEVIEGNRKLAERPATPEELAAKPKEPRKTLIETRGLRGFVVCAPSPGYEVFQGSLLEIPTITVEERELLIGVACLQDQMPTPIPAPRPAPKANASLGERVGDDFEEKATWEDVLEPHGWQKAGRMYGGMQLWVRPGKDRRKGWSARTGVGDVGDRFVCWSTAAGLPTEKPITKFALYAFLNHGSDPDPFGAAAKDLARQGFGRPKLPPGPPVGHAPAPSDEGSSDEEPATEDDQLEMVVTDDEDLETDEEPGPKFPGTDLGNAQRFVSLYGRELRYCPDWGRWLTWDGSVWAEDAPENPRTRSLAHRMAIDLSKRQRTRNKGLALQSSGRINSMLGEAKALPGICVRYHELDDHDMLLAAPNGVIDLRTGRLLDPDPDLLITKSVTVPFDPDAECPTFERFLMEIMKERRELVDLVVRALGYSLTGSNAEQKFFLMYGERGRNGKGTLIGVMQQLLGPGLCALIRKKLLTDSDAESARFSKAQIEGKRIVYADETKKGARFDVEFIKDFTGARWMEAERKGKDAYPFKLRAKLWYAVNSLPGADFDPAFKDRLIPIPFEQSFYSEDNENYQVGDLTPDKYLDEKLSAERAGILALLVKGCLRWQEMGGLGQPHQVVELKRKYEQDNDGVALWIAERCCLGESCRSKATDLFQNFREFAKTMGLRGAGRIGDFNARLERQPGIRQVKPNNVSWFTGIELRRMDQPPLDGPQEQPRRDDQPALGENE